MKLKSLFILFFSIFLLSLSSEAMAENISIGENSVCATECAKIACTAATDTNKLTSAVTDVSVGPNASFNCSQPAAGKTDSDVAAALQPSCITKCNDIKNRIRQGAGFIEDAEYNISKNSFTRSACNALRIVTGGAGKTFATFVVIATGIGFFTGKVSWGLMIGVAAGIATMFGGPSIVAAISGESTNMMCGIN